MSNRSPSAPAPPKWIQPSASLMSITRPSSAKANLFPVQTITPAFSNYFHGLRVPPTPCQQETSISLLDSCPVTASLGCHPVPHLTSSDPLSNFLSKTPFHLSENPSRPAGYISNSLARPQGPLLAVHPPAQHWSAPGCCRPSTLSSLWPHSPSPLWSS